MNGYLKRYDISLTAKSPLHIGSGEKKGNKEYIYDRRRAVIYYPNLHNMLNELGTFDIWIKNQMELLSYHPWYYQKYLAVMARLNFQ